MVKPQQQLPFNGPLSGTTRVSRYQKGKNQSGFYWSKRQWVAVASAGPYASLHLALDRYPRQYPTTQINIMVGDINGFRWQKWIVVWLLTLWNNFLTEETVKYFSLISHKLKHSTRMCFTVRVEQGRLSLSNNGATEASPILGAVLLKMEI